RARAAVPDDAHRARSWAGLQPRHETRPGVGSVVHLHRLAPGVALVDGVRQVDVMAIRVGDVDGAARRSVLSDLHREEDVGYASGGHLVAAVRRRGDARPSRRPCADLATRPADIDSAARLVNVDLADLTAGTVG